MASEEGHTDVVDLLLKAGADVHQMAKVLPLYIPPISGLLALLNYHSSEGWPPVGIVVLCVCVCVCVCGCVGVWVWVCTFISSKKDSFLTEYIYRESNRLHCLYYSMCNMPHTASFNVHVQQRSLGLEVSLACPTMPCISLVSDLLTPYSCGEVLN